MLDIPDPGFRVSFSDPCDTTILIQQARHGDLYAEQALLVRYRDRLTRLISAMVDPRIATDIQVFEIVHDALARANARIQEFLETEQVSIYPWLRGIAMETLTEAERSFHPKANSEDRHEQYADHQIPDELAAQLVWHIDSNDSGSCVEENDDALLRHMKLAFGSLSHSDRELVTMRYLEGLSIPDIAQILGITEAAAAAIVRRSLDRLEQRLFQTSNPET